MTSLYDELEKKLQDSNATPMFLPLQFLKAITSDFSTESELGRGGFGVVYKGVLPSGKIIAVKKLFEIHLVDDKTFQSEVNSLMEVRHQHVVQFVGYCAESSWETIKQPSGNFMWAEIPKRLLCFEYLCNQSLDKYISVPTDESLVLEWNMRYKIIKGICNGLNFLHEERRMVHLDLKPENILMDATMMPKIADFGLSRIFSSQQSRILTNNFAGSRGYMAPEYLIQGIISRKADIFSLGVIIIEIITGRRDYPYFQLDSPESNATSCQHFIEEVLGSWRYKFQSTAKYISIEKYNQQLKQCIAIALKCVDPNMEKRPTANDVIQVLNTVDQMESHEELRTDIQGTYNSLVPNTIPSIIFKAKGKVVDEAKSDESLSPMPTLSESSTGNQNYQKGAQAFSEPQSTRDTTTKTKHSIPPSIKIISMGYNRGDDQIFSMDSNQTEPLIITGYRSGCVGIRNHDTQKPMGSISLPKEAKALSVKFIERNGWFLVGSSDGFIRVYNYKKKMKIVTSFKVRDTMVRSLAIHPTQPYVLAACCTRIKLWDWDHRWFGWRLLQTFHEHSGVVRVVAFNPQDYNSFASASDDGTITVWSLDSPKSKCTFYLHLKAVYCLEFFTGGDGQQYLVAGCSDNSAKILDMQTRECVRTLTHSSGVLSVLPYPNLPLLITGTKDGTVSLWSSTNFRLERKLKVDSQVQALAYLIVSGSVAVAHLHGLSVIEIRDEGEQGGCSSSSSYGTSSKPATFRTRR